MDVNQFDIILVVTHANVHKLEGIVTLRCPRFLWDQPARSGVGIPDLLPVMHPNMVVIGNLSEWLRINFLPGSYGRWSICIPTL